MYTCIYSVVLILIIITFIGAHDAHICLLIHVYYDDMAP